MLLGESSKLHEIVRNKLGRLETLMEEAEKREAEVSSFLSEQNRFKQKHILWIYGQTGLSDASIIKSFQSKGISNVREEQLPLNDYGSVSRFDVVVFSVGATDNIDDTFVSLLIELKSNSEPPVIVYTYNDGAQIRLGKEEWKILDTYDNYTVANFPGSLQTTLNNIVRWL